MRRRSPDSETSLLEKTVVDRFEMMKCGSEQVLNRAVDREKSLNLFR
jgi:hypothetical protein